MGNLRDLNLKSVYRTGHDDLLNDFYIPLISLATRYDRAVGYFSTSLLEYALKGISKIAIRNGKIRIVVGYPLSDDEYDALIEGSELKNTKKRIDQDFERFLTAERNQLGELRLKLFRMLIANGNLELKFACKRNGMYHEKIGIVYDEFGNKVLFQGSANETTNAINPDLNFESITVFRSWNLDAYEEYAVPFEKGFNDLWNGNEKNIFTLEMPSETYARIKNAVKNSDNTDFEAIINEIDESLQEANLIKESSKGYPEVPTYIGDKTFKPHKHQEKALRNWFENGKKGLFKLATGSGKTITAMYGFTKIFKTAKQPRKMFVVVAVPYQALAEQWSSELKLFNVSPIKCFYSRDLWEEKLNNSISLLINGDLEFACAVVVNRTLLSDRFLKIISRLPSQNLFFIGDECHRHASYRVIEKLPDAAFKMGLSATPYIEKADDFDEVNEEKSALLEYYGDIICEYTLGDALADGVLTDYDYHIVFVELTQAEGEEYSHLTKEIGKQLSIDRSSDNARLASLIRQRNNIVANCTNKKNVLKSLLESNKFLDKKHTLFYVGEGASLDSENDEPSDISQLENIAQIAKTCGWKLSKFTASETPSERKSIMDSFVSAEIDGLVSMKVLDEGIDIPACKRAFILASSRNPRQFIQRRGRILRKSKGKNKAEIFDFIVVPPIVDNSSPGFRDLVKKELSRAMEFIRLAKNRMNCENEAIKVAEAFDINIDEL